MSTLEHPTPFGPYLLNRRVAVGGMAEVYAATVRGSDGFQKPVAVKRIHRHLSSDDQFVSMLIAEAKLCAGLLHRNIVQTFDLGCIDGSHFIVMEEVEGHDLGHVLATMRARGEALPWSLGAYIAAELCRGLSYAHGRANSDGEPLGIVHRDVSPQNLLLSFAGEVKIADFGIAKSAARMSDPEAGVIKGKYFYMSPEQAWGDPLDPRTDIFSAGVVLWEMLTGQALRRSSTVSALLEELREGRVMAPSFARPGLPPELDSIVARATAIDLSARYPSASAMADDLEEAVAQCDFDPPSRLRGVLTGIEPSTKFPVVGDEREVPKTRGRDSTVPRAELATPTNPTLRFSLEDGRPTVSGRRSPVASRHERWQWAVVGVVTLATVAGLWWLGGLM